MTLPTRALGRSGLEITVQCSLRPIGASGDDEIKRENKLSHCTYSASRFVYEVPGPIGPGYSPFAPSALRKTSPNSLAVEQVNRSSKLSQNVLIFAQFGSVNKSVLTGGRGAINEEGTRVARNVGLPDTLGTLAKRGAAPDVKIPRLLRTTKTARGSRLQRS
jgi:hypothetical protein